MKRAAILLAILFASCRTGPVAATNPYADRTDAALAGAKLFRAHCSECHGVDADGRIGPSLRTASVQDRSDAALFTFITNGDLRNGMPSWSRLPDERRWQIVSYLRSLVSASPRASSRSSCPEIRGDETARERRGSGQPSRG